MAIRDVVTRGFGNGTYDPGVAKLPVRGYAISVVLPPTIPGLEYTMPDNRLHYTVIGNRLHYTLPANRLHYTLGGNLLHHTLPDNRLHYTLVDDD